jgi:glycosyltransferase involved in cell wall biosynthesis
VSNSLVSIIIPVYNTEPYIKECLDSCINQTYTNLEIICINDGSTDNSLKVLEQYAKTDKRIKVINKKNEGVGIARNTGIEAATGEWISFLDSDDLFSGTRAIETFVEAAERHNLDYVLSNWNWYDDEKMLEIPNRFQFSSRSRYPKYILNTPFTYEDNSSYAFELGDGIIWGALFKSKFLKDNKILFQNLTFFQDTVFIINLICFKPRTMILPDLYSINYRIDREGNSESKRGKKNIELVFDVLATVQTTVESHSLDKKLEESLVKMKFYSLKNIIDRLSNIEDYYKLSDLAQAGGLEKAKMTDELVKKYLSKQDYTIIERLVNKKNPIIEIGNQKSPFDKYPLVSIIIPVYNTEQYLDQCLDSCINQTYTNLEIICINDGSTDNSLKVLEQYAKTDNRIKVIDKKNEGVGIARNTGIEVATSEWISFLDSDDFLELDTIYQLLSSTTDKNVDVIKAGFSFYDDLNNCKNEAGVSKNILKLFEKELSYDDYCDNIFQIVTPSVWGALFSKSFLQNNKLFFKPFKYAEDTEFLFRVMLMKPNVTRIKSSVYNYRLRRSGNTVANISQSFDSDTFLSTFDIISEFKNQSSSFKKDTLQSFVGQIFEIFLYSYNHLESLEHYYALAKFSREQLFPNIGLTELQIRGFLSKQNFEIYSNIMNDLPPVTPIGEIQRLESDNEKLKETNQLLKKNLTDNFGQAKNVIRLNDRLIKSKFSKLNKLCSLVGGAPIYRAFSRSKNPKVSIIGIFFNQEKYIHKWMDCIQNQTLKDIEIICVDGGGGKDNSVKVLKRYAKYDKRIKLVLHDKNYGIHKSRKDATMLATGQYIMYLDGDDYMYPESAKKAYNIVTKKSLDFLMFGADVYPTKFKFNKESRGFYNYINSYKNIQMKNFSTQYLFENGKSEQNIWRVISKNSCLKSAFNLSTDVFMNINDDVFEFELLLLQSNKIKYINENLAIYTFGAGSFSNNSNNLKIIKDTVDSCNFRYKFWNNYNFENKEYAKKFLLEKSYSYEPLKHIFMKLGTSELQIQGFDYYIKNCHNVNLTVDLQTLQKIYFNRNELDYFYETVKLFDNEECREFLRLSNCII